ncbi:hypothetical protein CEXT_584931 [Caerostris extrusa]|uniref:Uncharacterized protein n=1 Tax=Caerostris extrusa TaxID=172846 RepID=A0AAV4SWZ6_CAEEX|nr:hypothetical protein CEXT_584931 [Caerostris extrusa]
MCFLHQLVPSYVALSFYSTSILGIILQIVLYSKRYEYCMISSLIFITISIAISKEQSLSSDLVTVFTVWNFVISVYMFYQVTMSGSAVYEEGEELKKIGLEYSDEASQ